MKILFLIVIFMKIFVCDYDHRIITTLKHSKYYIKPLVVNGSPAREGDVPYLVSIKTPNTKIGSDMRMWNNLCGGSIIGKSKVLTAAHCFEQNSFFYQKYPYLLRVVAGNLRTDLMHSGETETTEQGQWRTITKAVVHSYFHFPQNDIALVFVNKPWDYTNKVDYILPASLTVDYLMSKCYSAGYGSTNYFGAMDSSSEMLLTAKIDPMPRVKCSYIWEMNMDDFICTQSLFSDVARGDSGGPLTCSNTLDPKEEAGRDVLVGVVSGKNFDLTTIFTRVSQYQDWIAADSGSELKFSYYLPAITFLILIYLLFYSFPLIVLV